MPCIPRHIAHVDWQRISHLNLCNISLVFVNKIVLFRISEKGQKQEMPLKKIGRFLGIHHIIRWSTNSIRNVWFSWCDQTDGWYILIVTTRGLWIIWLFHAVFVVMRHQLSAISFSSSFCAYFELGRNM